MTGHTEYTADDMRVRAHFILEGRALGRVLTANHLRYGADQAELNVRLVAALKMAEQALFIAARQLMEIAGIDEDETIVEELEQIRGVLASVES